MPFLNSVLRRQACRCRNQVHGKYARFGTSSSSSSSSSFHNITLRQTCLSNLSQPPITTTRSLSSTISLQPPRLFVSQTWNTSSFSTVSTPSRDHPDTERLSATASSSFSSSDDELQQYSKYLCQSSFPLKRLSASTVTEIASAIKRLTAFTSSSNNSNSSKALLESHIAKVQLALQLIDRLTLEIEATRASAETVIDSDLIHNAILDWRQIAMNPKLPQRFHHLKQASLTPADVFDKMKAWQERMPTLSRNIVTYTLIINAATQSQQQDPDLAEAIFDYLAESRLAGLGNAPVADDHGSTTLNIPDFPIDETLFNSVIDCWAKSNRDDAPLRAEKMLTKMNEWSDAGWSEVQPSVVTYNSVMNTWAAAAGTAPSTTTNMFQGSISAPQRAEQLLEEMKQRGLVPDRWSYSSVLTAWARNYKLPGAPDRANAILQHMKSLYEQQQQHLVEAKPTYYCYSAVMSAYANHGNVHQAEQLLCELTERYQATRDRDFLPDVTCFTSVIHAWAKSGQKDAAHQAEAMLQRMQEFAASTGETSIRPDVVSFTAVLQAWAQSKHPQAPYRCEAILKRMQELHDNGYANTQPNVVSYTVVLDCWAKATSVGNAAERAEAILRQMQTLYQSGQNPHAKPTVLPYTNVINAWSRSSLPNAAQRAQALYDEMIQQWEAGDVKMKPHVITVTALVSAWGRCKSKEGAKRAQAVFDEAVARHDRKRSDVPQSPSSEDAYSELVKAWGQSDGQEDIAPSIQDDSMSVQSSGDLGFKPTVITYSALIDAWAKAGEVERAEQVLREMESKGVTPNSFTYTVVINAWSRSRRPNAVHRAQALFEELERRHKAGEPDMKPGMYAYTALISAWGRIKTKQGAERAQAIFDNVLAQYEAGAEDLKPNSNVYCALIDAWAKAGEAEKAEHILRQMIANQFSGVKPSVVAYTSVIDAWSRRGRPAHAHAIYHEMIRKWEGGDTDMKPSIHTFTVLMSAWGRSKSADGAAKAQAIFDSVKTRYEATGDPDLKPTNQTYNALIDAWSKAGQAEKAEAVLREMKSAGAKPDFMSYTAAIDAFSRSGRPDAGPRSQALFDELIQKWKDGDNSVKPSLYTYTAVISAWGRSRSLAGATKAQAVYDDLLSRHRSGDADLKPTKYACSALIDAWVKAGKPAEAEAVVRNASEGRLAVKPNFIMYCAVMRAWSRSGHPDAPDRMQALYDDMMSKYRNGDGDLKPDFTTYETMMDAWIRTKSPHGIAKAAVVFKDMKAHFDSGGLELKDGVAKYRAIIAGKAKAMQIQPW